MWLENSKNENYILKKLIEYVKNNKKLQKSN